MKATLLKANQAELKAGYGSAPRTAVQKLSSHGIVDPENLSVNITLPSFLNPTGLHPSSGGDGSFACPVEIMLAGWVSCAGVTLAAVANSMKIELKKAEITANGTIDFKGTLAVDRDAPVGLTALELSFQIEADVDREKIEKLVQLTERYCVVHQTLVNAPGVKTNIVVN